VNKSWPATRLTESAYATRLRHNFSPRIYTRVRYKKSWRRRMLWHGHVRSIDAAPAVSQPDRLTHRQHNYTLQRAQTPPRRRPLVRIKCLYPSVKKSEKLILHPHPDPDQHQKLITRRGSSLGSWVKGHPLGHGSRVIPWVMGQGSSLAHTYHVWSTSVTRSWVILLTTWLNDRRTDGRTGWQTDKQ